MNKRIKNRANHANQLESYDYFALLRDVCMSCAIYVIKFAVFLTK